MILAVSLPQAALCSPLVFIIILVRPVTVVADSLESSGWLVDSSSNTELMIVSGITTSTSLSACFGFEDFMASMTFS